MKNVKRVLAVSLASVLLVSGCSNASKSETASSKEYKLKNVSFPLKEKVTLNFMTQSSPLAPADPNKKLIYKRLEEQTGVHIKWKNYTSDAFIEKRNLAMASGDLPDAILDAGFNDHDLLKLGKDGAIIPVEDLIEKYMPNLQKVLEAAPNIKQ